jgi:hypothetical protein
MDTVVPGSSELVSKACLGLFHTALLVREGLSYL